MDLEKLISTNEQSYEMWIEFKDFEIKIRYIDKAELQSIMKRSKVRKFDRRTHQPLENYSDEKLSRHLAHLILDWRGLTLEKLAELVPIEVQASEADKPVPFSEKNAETLVQQAYGLDNFLMATVTDLQAFREEKLEEEVKN